MGLDHKRLLELLQGILDDKNDRQDKIHEFQEIIWNNEDDNVSERVLETYNELALDLDFYEPNPEWRKQDPSFYGDDKLEEEVKRAIRKIETAKSDKGTSRKDEEDFEDEEDSEDDF